MQSLNPLFARLSVQNFALAFVGHERASVLSGERRASHRTTCGGFLAKRLSALPVNDGKQTPMRGHPVFIAQHATATCCRGCVAKWHNFRRVLR
ncbi:DUF4186 family protein [Escherichia coli]